MTSKCMYEPTLECSEKERADELYRQMQEKLRTGQQITFCPRLECVARATDCSILKTFREQMQKQK